MSRPDFTRSLSSRSMVMQDRGKCRPAELVALRDFAGAGYAVNGVMRDARNGLVKGTPLAAHDLTRIKAIASGINCIKQSRVEVVVRGVKLNAAQIAAFKAGQTVVFRAFSSTTPNGQPPDHFSSPVMFRIWDAEGALLEDINPEREEQELTINAGTLFHVMRVVQDLDGFSVIELQQILAS